MAKVKVLYKTDQYHSYGSRELIGIYTNQAKFRKDVIKLIREDLQEDSGQMDAEEEKKNINWHIGFFFEKKQTQGLNNEELVCEELELNEIF